MNSAICRVVSRLTQQLRGPTGRAGVREHTSRLEQRSHLAYTFSINTTSYSADISSEEEVEIDLPGSATVDFVAPAIPTEAAKGVTFFLLSGQGGFSYPDQPPITSTTASVQSGGLLWTSEDTYFNTGAALYDFSGAAFGFADKSGSNVSFSIDVEITGSTWENQLTAGAGGLSATFFTVVPPEACDNESGNIGNGTGQPSVPFKDLPGYEDFLGNLGRTVGNQAGYLSSSELPNSDDLLPHLVLPEGVSLTSNNAVEFGSWASAPIEIELVGVALSDSYMDIAAKSTLGGGWQVRNLGTSDRTAGRLSNTGTGAESRLRYLSPAGIEYKFYPMSHARSGLLDRVLLPDGQVYEVEYTTGTNRPASIVRRFSTGGSVLSSLQLGFVDSTGSELESLSYAKGSNALGSIAFATNGGRVVEMVRRDGAIPAAGGLESEFDPIVERRYLRYDSFGRLQLYLTGSNYERAATELFAELETVDFDSVSLWTGPGNTVPNLVRYADQYFEYSGTSADSPVSRMLQNGMGAGCAACGVTGLGEYTYEYESFADYYWAENGSGVLPWRNENEWNQKTTITLPDGNQRVLYLNPSGQTILEIETDNQSAATSGVSGAGTTTSSTFVGRRTWYRYHDGNVVLTAHSSAVTGYHESLGDLVGYTPSTGYATHLADSSGLIEVTSRIVRNASLVEGEVYAQTVGEAVGEVVSVYVLQGDHDTIDSDSLLRSYTYNTESVSPRVATMTEYAGGSMVPAVTTYEYSEWYTDSNGVKLTPKRVVTKLPVIPGAADTASTGSSSNYKSESVFDGQGREVWARDADGHLTYSEYDSATGALTKRIIDVDTDSTADFSTALLPSGWTSSNGLHLKTEFEVDHLGRVTKEIDANGNVSFTAYDDHASDGSERSVRHYRGWIDGSPTVPVQASVENPSLGVRDTVTYSWSGSGANALPTLGGAPTGEESWDSGFLAIQSLSRTVLNLSGQAIERKDYSGLATSGAYSPESASYGGTALTSIFRYDARGRLFSTQSPDGTIRMTIHDGLGRVSSTWSGTNSAGSTGYDPSGLTPPSGVSSSGNNMLRQSLRIYDFGGRGDSNVTESRQYFGSGGTDYLASQYRYDFRSRRTDSRGPNRIASKYTLDRLGRPIEVVVYADSDADFDFDINATTRASQIRSIQRNYYDNQNHVATTQVFEVDPTSGFVPLDSAGGWANDRLTTSYWHDLRGNLVKTASPGGLFSKVTIDGAGRTTATYLSYDADETAYSEATSISDDVVIEQSKSIFDPGGRVAVSTSYKRTGSSPSTGELGANNSFIQVAVMWYDAADRSIGSASYGRDNGSTRYVFGTGGALVDSDSDGLPDEYENGQRLTNTSDDYIVSRTRYDAAGRVWRSFDNLDAYDSVNGSTASDSGFTEFTYDLLGRRTKMVENYANGVATETESSTDRTTEWVYDNWGRLQILRAKNPKGSGNGVQDQSTVYLYADNVDRSRVSYTLYPDSSSTYTVNSTTGVGSISSGSDHVHVVYDRLGRVDTSTDQRGVTHDLRYSSVTGRLTMDTITAFGSSGVVDESVGRVVYSYDDVSRPASITSYRYSQDQIDEWEENSEEYEDLVSSDVAYGYDGWGNVAWSGQSGGGNWSVGMPTVTYVYGDGAVNGEAKHVRLERVVYPSGRSVYYNYASSGEGVPLVRLDNIAPTPKPNTSGTAGDYYAKFEYLGASTITAEKRPDAVGASLVYNVDSDWDRFGRVLNHNWTRPASQGSGTTDGFSYAYDRNSNRLTRDYTATLQNSATSTDTVSSNGFDELYTYDGLDRLASVNRGTLSSGSISSSTFTQNWSGLDALGNWSTFGQDVDGAGSTSATTQTRAHNAVNEVGTISGTGADWVDGVYDAAGNMTTMPVPGSETTALNAKYDAWNRMTQATIGSVTYTYKYDGLNRLVAKSTADSVGGAVTGTERLYYNENWQLLETRKGTVDQSQSDMDTSEQYVWSPRYIDALILRDRFTDSSGAAGLDATFDGDGKVVTNLGGTDQGRKVVVQPDGKTIVVGYTNNGLSSNALALVRYNEDGSLDSTFGTSGVVITDISTSTSDQANSVALQPDGKIVVAGIGNTDGVLVRYNTDGSVDTGFGTSGKATYAYSSGSDPFTDLVIQPDGKIVAVGRTVAGYGAVTFVTRFTSSGSLDTSFDGDGIKIVSVSGYSSLSAVSVALDNSDKILIVGTHTLGAGGLNDIFVVRLLTNGDLDTSFSTDGLVIIGESQDSIAFGRSIAVMQNNKIVVGGYKTNDDNYSYDFLAARLLTDGSMDTTFSGDGIATFDRTTNVNDPIDDYGYALLVQPDGKVLIGGSTGTAADFAIVRFRADGVLDTSFDGDGVAMIAFTTQADVGWSMAATPEGKLMIAGYAAALSSDFALARYNGSVGNERLFATSDVQASVTAVVDRTGTVKARLTYTPYGQATLQTKMFGAATSVEINLSSRLQFQGLLVDIATNLRLARNRWENANLGWIKRDPAGYTDGYNQYESRQTSPATTLDPSGLKGALGAGITELSILAAAAEISNAMNKLQKAVSDLEIAMAWVKASCVCDSCVTEAKYSNAMSDAADTASLFDIAQQLLGHMGRGSYLGGSTYTPTPPIGGIIRPSAPGKVPVGSYGLDRTLDAGNVAGSYLEGSDNIKVGRWGFVGGKICDTLNHASKAKTAHELWEADERLALTDHALDWFGGTLVGLGGPHLALLAAGLSELGRLRDEGWIQDEYDLAVSLTNNANCARAMAQFDKAIAAVGAAASAGVGATERLYDAVQGLPYRDLESFGWRLADQLVR